MARLIYFILRTILSANTSTDTFCIANPNLDPVIPHLSCSRSISESAKPRSVSEPAKPARSSLFPSFTFSMSNLHPMEAILTADTSTTTVLGVEGLQILKSKLLNGVSRKGIRENGFSESEKQIVKHGGVDLAVDVVTSEEDVDVVPADWVVEYLKFSITEPIEAVMKKDELQYLTLLCKSEVDSLGRIVAGVL